MNNYKCSNCGLTNWLSAANCKRCKMPNQYLSGVNQLNFQDQQYQPAAQNFAPSFANEQPVYSQTAINAQSSDTAIETNSPPPPNVYGKQTGQPYGTATARFQPIYGQTNKNQSPPITDETSSRLKKALKQIRYARTAALLLTVALGGVTLMVYFAMANTGKADSISHQSSLPQQAQDLMSATFWVLLLSTLIYGILTIGIHRKSRVCAVIFFLIALIGMFIQIPSIMKANSGQMIGQILVDLLIGGLFLAGIVGTMNYHEIIEENPFADS